VHLNCNNNGQRLVDFAAAKNMMVSSTCFPHKEIHKQTWRSPDGKTNNQIYHILIDNRNASSMLDVKSCREQATTLTTTWLEEDIPVCLKSKCTDFLFNYLLDLT
jgi:hypothetical protein